MPTVPPSAFPAVAPTHETDWIHLVANLPELAISTRPVVVLAPHPDDESLAVGGLLAELASRDVPVTVVTATDGEGSHPGWRGLAGIRAAEQAGALRALGIDTAAVRLGLPDGSVARHVHQLAHALEERCDQDTVLLAPWDRDGHTDHDACGAAARQAADDVGARLLAYPLWAWQWATVADLEPLALRRTSLSEAARDAKAAAIACYGSQLNEHGRPPIVSAEFLTHFLRPWEVLIDVC